MLDYKERAREELEQLRDRCEKCEAFIGTDEYDKLNDGDQILLLSQAIHMTGYYMILAQRVERF